MAFVLFVYHLYLGFCSILRVFALINLHEKKILLVGGEKSINNYTCHVTQFCSQVLCDAEYEIIHSTFYIFCFQIICMLLFHLFIESVLGVIESFSLCC